MPNPPSRARRLPPPAPWSMARCWCWYSTSFFRRHFSSNGQTMSTSKNRVDLAVGVFLLLAFATLMVLAISRSEEHTSELQSLMRISYAVFCLTKKKQTETLQVQLQHTHISHKKIAQITRS